MKRVVLCLLLATGCAYAPQSSEQQAIAAYMQQHAKDPASYEPVLMRYLGPATYENTGVRALDTTRTGYLYEHTFRAKNGFGEQVTTTKVFVLQHGKAFLLPDSVGGQALVNFSPLLH